MCLKWLNRKGNEFPNGKAKLCDLNPLDWKMLKLITQATKLPKNSFSCQWSCDTLLSQKATEQLWRSSNSPWRTLGQEKRGSFRLWGALHRRESHPSPVIYLVTTGIGTIAVGGTRFSPTFFIEVCRDKKLPLCFWELPWHSLIHTKKSQRTMMLSSLDAIQTPKGCTHIMHSILLLRPRQAKRCQGSKSKTRTNSTCVEQCFRTYLGTPGGARLGREGTWGGGPKGSGEAPGLEGTGGADPPAGGGPGAGPRDPGLAGGTAGALLCGVGLDVGDLPNKQRHSTAATALGSLCHHRLPSELLSSFTSLHTPPFGYQGPHQASGCLQSYVCPSQPKALEISTSL